MEPSAADALLFLERVPQPIWVGDETGDVIYSNEASLTLTGYTKEEYWGRSGHELTHYLHRDGTPYPVSECPMLTPRLTGETIHCDEDWFIRPRWHVLSHLLVGRPDRSADRSRRHRLIR